MKVLQLAPYCNRFLQVFAKVAKLPSEMIDLQLGATVADFTKKTKKKPKNLIKKVILVVMVSTPLETLARRNLPQLRYMVI